ncbi:MAG: excinuclease ABC subunit UvrB [Patescibacteria group bacterium]|jgi:excinuclease ABC subunit B
MDFKISSKFKPAGDQPAAISKLVDGIKKGFKHQTLLGVTGSGKTFSIANVIEKVQKPTLVIAHNKTLAAQLCSEFRTFFPESAVEYFVSYYDYYQPEAYMPNTDIYIEKDVEINEEIDRLRHAATQALLARRDVIVVASVSCIYGLGSPEVYRESHLNLAVGEEIAREDIINRLVEMYFERSEILSRGKFRVHGGTIEIMPADREVIIRIEIEKDWLTKITVFEAVTMRKLYDEKKLMIYPAKHFVVTSPTMQKSIMAIEKELKERVSYFEKRGKFVEAERLRRRTRYDLELLREIGYCAGIENYSRYLTGRKEGQAPYTLIDYFPEDFLMIIDESHVTIPQLRGMFEGDKSRKDSLVEHGFRLPSARDNRPLKFPEFQTKINQVIYTTATPASFEREHSKQIVEQIIRPTGLVDPEVEVRSIEGQVDDLTKEIKKRAKAEERILVTTLTKRMAEELSDHFKEIGVRAEYLHSEVDTLDRVGILENLRKGEFDVLVGVNLLREGLDLPEVSLVAILDADKEGFLRSDVSLVQTIGRAARNVRGMVILYADNMTGSMKRAIDETNRRRAKQIKFNVKHHITPKTIQKTIESIIDHELRPEVTPEFIDLEKIEDLPAAIRFKEIEMKKAAQNLEFERAAILRDEIIQLKKLRLR